MNKWSLSLQQYGVFKSCIVGYPYHFQFMLLLFLLNEVQLFGQQQKAKVVMISIDGTPDYLVDHYLKTGVLPQNGAFAKMKKFGAYAETMLPVNVASTGPSHISIFTGASPANTGIVGNSFRRFDQPWEAPSLSAFRQPLKAETIFQAAMRQGKKVVVLGGVGVDHLGPERRTDFMYMYPSISGPSLVLDLVPDGNQKNVNGKYFQQLTTIATSPSAAIYELSNNVKLPLYIYQSDSAENVANILHPVSQVIIDEDADLSNGYNARITGHSWTTMIIHYQGKQYTSSFRIVDTNSKEKRIRLFMSAPAEVFGYPATFFQYLQTKCGLWPGEPENRKQTSGLISEEIWFEQVDRLAAYSRDLILAGMQTNQWDLLFGYFSTLDDVQHRYTLTDPRQLDYAADNGKRPQLYASILERYFKKVDRYLLQIMNAAPKGTNFILFSDHGMIPVHTTLLLGNLLERSGFSVTGQMVKSLSSGNSAHIYLNNSLLAPAVKTDYLNRLSKHLLALKDSLTGEPVFELVADSSLQKNLGLYHPEYSGELFVSCRKGYSLSDKVLQDVPVFVKNSFDPALFATQNQAVRNFLINGTMNETGRGVHGNLASVREGQSIFYAIGPDMPRGNLGNVNSLQIAASVADLLSINPPFEVEMMTVFQNGKQKRSKSLTKKIK